MLPELKRFMLDHGLCLVCGRKKENAAFSACAACRARQARAMGRRRKRRQQLGLCIYCGRDISTRLEAWERAPKGRRPSLCRQCAEKERERRKAGEVKANA